MWVGNLLAANRSGRLPFSARTGIDDHTRLTKKGSPRTATRRRPPSSERRKAPESARQRLALSRMASKMGCKSCGELAMARSTSEMAVCCSMSSVTRSCGSEAILSAWIPSFMRSSLGLDGEDTITAPAAVRDSSHGRPNRRCGQTSNICEVAHRSLRCVTVRLGYSQNDGATISWSVERLLEGFDMSRRPLLFCRGAILLAACRAAPAFNSPCRRSQTLRRDAALVSRPKEQATRPRVLLWILAV